MIWVRTGWTCVGSLKVLELVPLSLSSAPGFLLRLFLLLLLLITKLVKSPFLLLLLLLLPLIIFFCLGRGVKVVRAAGEA